jgi:hypothetical protein
MTRSNLKPIDGVVMLLCSALWPALFLGWTYVAVLAAVVGVIAWAVVTENLIARD